MRIYLKKKLSINCFVGVLEPEGQVLMGSFWFEPKVFIFDF